MDGNERRTLYKQAAKVKKHTRSKNGKPDSLDEIVLGLLEQEEAIVSSDGPTSTGTVVWVGRKTCRVDSDECALNGHRVAVGDSVAVAEDRVQGILPRKTLLSRPDPGNPNAELPIAANIDLVVIVVSAMSPPLHVRIIDRYLIAIERSGAQAALVVNKLDLLEAAERAEELSKLSAYRDVGIPIILASAESREGISALRELVCGKLCAFVGHSGVGKSSLLNALDPGLAELTGAVSEGYGRGRHTTTWSSLHELEAGTRIIDTPGIRSLGLGELTAQELKWHFPEFDEARCKFSDCTHTHEPGCGVKASVGRRIRPDRYDTYLRLLSC